MIYTVTLNPAVDYALEADTLCLGATNRASREAIRFGGKGINVSRMLKILGVPSVALGFAAGFTGEAMERGLSEEGIATELIRLDAGFSRINIKLRVGETETELNGRGPEIPDAKLEALLTKLEALGEGDTLVLGGSLPPSVPADFYCRMLAAVEGRGVRSVVDTTGEALLRTLSYRPFLIKPNRAELEELAGRTLPDREAIMEAAQELRGKGAEHVLVTLGAEGAMLCAKDGFRLVPAHKGVLRCSVGAGDATVAGFLAGSARTEDRGRASLSDALRLGNAAGGAVAFSDGAVTKADVLALMEASKDAVWEETHG